jgi:tetratricopeptide (TPR) repeat protein
LALSNLPNRNPFFTGRERVLAQLQEALAAQGRAALSGLGGVGKTQTAMEYAHRHLQKYDYALWATADSREALLSGYWKIAGLLNLPESEIKDQRVGVGAVLRWLSSHQRWLLILDNADDIAMTREFIPSGENGHVLLTTRASAVGAVARLVEIQEMGIDEGALFLLRRADPKAEYASLGAAVEGDLATAKEIAKELGRLPLALEQAGAYIEETGCGLSDYLVLYRSHAEELLRHRTLTSDFPSVASTWVLSFEKIEKANAAAAELLRICAFLHPDAIPEEVLDRGAPELGPTLAPVASNRFLLDMGISEIRKFSLMRRDSKARTLWIHRLVQTVLKQGMTRNTQRMWAERAVRALDRAFPNVDFSNWPLCDRLLPQAQVCAKLINQWDFEFSEAARLLNEAGVYLSERGRYTDVEPLYQRALAIRTILGPENPDVATTLNNLAGLYVDRGQYANAEPLFKRALAIREKALGPEHLDEAEPLVLRGLKIREKALDPEHPSVAISLKSLARLYHARQQYAAAEPLMQRALTIREKVRGPEHPSVATILNDLGTLYCARGWHEKAETLILRGLEIREKALGTEHSQVARSLVDLAGLYDARGRCTDAEPLYRRAREIFEKALGPEHLDVATCLKNYALLLRKMGRPEEAEPLEARATAIRAKSA